MVSQYKIFPIPMNRPSEIETQLNKFLSTHRVLSTQKEFRVEQNQNYICFVVEYLANAQSSSTQSSKGQSSTQNDSQKSSQSSNQVDYKEILTTDEFQLFLQLKDWRKAVGEKLDGVPLYAIFTNAQLAQICQKRIKTKSALQKLNGVGDGKVNNYGDAVIKIVSEYFKEDAPTKEKKEEKT